MGSKFVCPACRRDPKERDRKLEMYSPKRLLLFVARNFVEQFIKLTFNSVGVAGLQNVRLSYFLEKRVRKLLTDHQIVCGEVTVRVLSCKDKSVRSFFCYCLRVWT